MKTFTVIQLLMVAAILCAFTMCALDLNNIAHTNSTRAESIYE